jgi:hypothetical protein
MVPRTAAALRALESRARARRHARCPSPVAVAPHPLPLPPPPSGLNGGSLIRNLNKAGMRLWTQSAKCRRQLLFRNAALQLFEPVLDEDNPCSG